MADASQFIQKVKLNAIQARGNSGVKVYTHLYTYVPPSTGITDFLSSSKFIMPFTLSLQGVPPTSKNSIYIRKYYIR